MKKKNAKMPTAAQKNTSDNLNIGDWVVEPTIGICQIQGIRTMKINNKSEDYFVFYDANNASLLIPRSKLKIRGVRPPMTMEDVTKLFVQLHQPTKPSRQEARVQYNVYREILLSGDPERICHMLRDLYALEQNNDLKGKEREMKEKAFDFLRDEISWVRDDEDPNKAGADITEALKQMYRRKVEKEQKEKKKK